MPLRLTAAELRVVIFLARGDERREIAEKMFISPHTVDAHCMTARQKLGKKSVAQLRCWAARHFPDEGIWWSDWSI